MAAFGQLVEILVDPIGIGLVSAAAAAHRLSRYAARSLRGAGWMFRKVWFLLALLLAFWPGVGHGASKREPPDYGAPKPEPGAEVLLWVPRVALFPVWVVSEYGLRRPIGALVRVAEREQWPAHVIQFFTFGDRDQITLFPSAFFDFGLKPSVGVNLGWKYFLAEPNTLHAHFGTWGPDWLAAKVVDQYELGAHDSVALDANVVRRKDIPFYGMGPRSGSQIAARFEATTVESAPSYERRFWRSSRLAARAGLRALYFGAGSCCGARSLSDAVAAGALPAPPGLGQNYAAAFQSLTLALDSRRPRPESGSGVRVETRGEAVFAPGTGPTTRRSWVSYGATLGAAYDIWSARTIALSVEADMVDPLQGTVPFPDQVTLGGERPMRGFLRDRLIDRSAAVGTLQYTWPVWVFLDGVLQADVGNVFGPHLQGFDAGLLRLSTGIGVRSNGDRDSGFELLVAGGTDPFEDGLRYSAFRLVIGSHHGF